MRSNHLTQHGFTLLELSIAMAVIGVVVAGGLSMSTSLVDQQAHVQTENQMDEIDKAISAYVAINERLPCPAAPSLSAGAIDFGAEHRTGNSCATTSGVTESNNVVIGMLPVRTLGLRDRYVADEYGNRYTYAVTRSHTITNDTSGYNGTAGRVIVHDNNGDVIVSDASYIVVSHGGDGKGAYRYESASNTVTCTGGLDEENCNGDNIFTTARFNRGSVGANWFDDNLHFKQKQLINVENGSGSSNDSTLWKESTPHIYNTNTGNVGIGTVGPDGKLAVIGDTFGQPTIKATRTANGIAVMGVGAGAAPAFHAEFDDQLGAGYYAVNNGWGGKLFEGLAAGVLTVGVDLTMSGEQTVGVAIRNSGLQSKGIDIEASGESSIGIRVNPLGTNSTAIMAYEIVKEGFVATTSSGAGNTRLYFGAAGSGNNNTGMELFVGGNNSMGIRSQVMGTSSSALSAYHMVPAQKGCTIGGSSSALACTYSGDNAASNVASINTSSQNKTGLSVSMGGPNGTAIRGSVIAPNSIALAAFNSFAGSRGCNLGTSSFSIDCVGAAGTVSDERLKTDVTALGADEGLAAINAIHPVRYRWKHEQDHHKELGFLAQDVEKVFPDVVGESSLDIPRDFKGPVKNVQYDRLIAPMVLAIQQLSAENNALKARLEALEKKLDEK